ncbi:MAG TPA: hypothetical protein VGB79_12720 [Allosphingosinicella sp.]|jgi:hypothetical protein
MRRTALDTLVRIVAMVLAGMVTLSILGAIAAMSEGGGRPAFPLDPRPSAMPEPRIEGPAPEPARDGLRRSGSSGETTVTAAAPPQPPGPEERSAQWLEVIAYVLFAIAFLLALGVLALWRLSTNLRRLANSRQKVSAQENRQP